jgi:hypothetical protein
MLTQKPTITSVRIKVQQFEGNKYIRSESITLYDTTAAQVAQFIHRNIAKSGKNGRNQ